MHVQIHHCQYFFNIFFHTTFHCVPLRVDVSFFRLYDFFQVPGPAPAARNVATWKTLATFCPIVRWGMGQTPQDPWDWYISLDLVDFYGKCVGKYTSPPGILWELTTNPAETGNLQDAKTPNAKQSFLKRCHTTFLFFFQWWDWSNSQLLDVICESANMVIWVSTIWINLDRHTQMESPTYESMHSKKRGTE